MGQTIKKQAPQEDELILEPEPIKNPFFSLKISEAYIKTNRIYSPFEPLLAIVDDNTHLVKATIDHREHILIKVQNLMMDRFQQLENPFRMCIHYVKSYEQEENFTDNIKGFLSLSKNLTVYCDYFKQSLKQKIRKEKMQIEDIWLLIDCISYSMTFLQTKKRYQGGLGLQQIYEVETPIHKNVYKLYDGISEYKTNDFYSGWLKEYEIHGLVDHQTLLITKPPQSTLDQIRDQVQLPLINYYKQDVFSFGILLLQVMLQEDVVDYIYDNVKLTINQVVLEKFLTQIPSEFGELMHLILQQDEALRPDWLELNKFIDKNFPGKRLLAQYEIRDFYFFYDFAHPPQLKKETSETPPNQTFYLDIDPRQQILVPEVSNKPVLKIYHEDEENYQNLNQTIQNLKVIKHHIHDVSNQQVSQMTTNRKRKIRKVIIDRDTRFKPLPIVEGRQYLQEPPLFPKEQKGSMVLDRMITEQSQ